MARSNLNKSKFIFNSTVKRGDKELFGHPKTVPYSPNVPYPYEVNWQLVPGNGSLTPICSLSPSLTVLHTTASKYVHT